MANHARGEADLVIAGKTYRVAMTMGALAEMAAALEVETFQQLNERVMACKVTDMIAITHATLKGNGHEVSIDEVRKMDSMVYLQDLIPAFVRRDTDAKPDGEARPPKRQKA